MKAIFFAFAIGFALFASLNATAKVSQQGGAAGVQAAEEQKAPKSFDALPKVGAKATCPVMGTEFTVKENSPRSEYKGKHYVFCCGGCKPKFDANPAKYAVK